MGEIAAVILANIIAPVITLVVGYYIGKPKAKAETENVEEQTQAAELENVKNALSIYREMVDDLGKKIEQSTNKINELMARIIELEKLLKHAENENKELKQQLNKN